MITCEFLERKPQSIQAYDFSLGSIGDFRGRLLLQSIQLIGELLQGDRGAHGTEAESD